MWGTNLGANNGGPYRGIMSGVESPYVACTRKRLCLEHCGLA